MERNWTLGQKLGFSFGIMVVFIGVLSTVAFFTLRQVIADKDRVIAMNAQMRIETELLAGKSDEIVSHFQTYLIKKDAQYEEGLDASYNDVKKSFATMDAIADSDYEKTTITKVKDVFLKMVEAVRNLQLSYKNGATFEQVSAKMKEDIIVKADVLDSVLGEFAKREQENLITAKAASTDVANTANWIVFLVGIFGFVLAGFFAFGLTRALNKQIGSAVQHIQSSSTELQSAANQQTSGTREQVTSMNEISTTIKELLATSRQIAESAQHVSHIAEDTASSARNGDLIVQRTQESMQTIKRQVDLIVTHMLDLGKKSQQAGGILEIINELAEQTNILSINATIEAAGAGEMGKRFVVVADEIRKLADRVAGSTKDIRTLIDDIRSAVNTTIMATEGGSKAVDAGAKQFSEVTVSFTQIVELVKTTTEAAREIELSTKQQSTSVEQVSSAMTTIAQTAKESETSSNQTLQTVSELTSLSKALARLVQAQA